MEEPARPADAPEEPVDPLPEKLLQTARTRLKSDGLACTIIGVMVFAVHCSTVSGAGLRREEAVKGGRVRTHSLIHSWVGLGRSNFGMLDF